MNTRAGKAQENKSQPVANTVSQQQSAGEPAFIDNRPEAVAQRKLQQMANKSAQAKQAAQLQALANNHAAQKQQPIQKKENNTGLPDNLKTGIESLSGISLHDVKVHFNSDKPSQLQAHAYAQGTEIHVAPGQEQHLPHEAWHVVQQKQGRVKPTLQMKSGVYVNDDTGLEKEADVMGAKAVDIVQKKGSIFIPFPQKNSAPVESTAGQSVNTGHQAVQRKRDIDNKQTQTDFEANRGRRGDKTEGTDTLAVVAGNYNESLTSGQGLMNEGVKWFTNAPDKKPSVSTEATLGKVASAGYKVFWFFRGDNVTVLMTRGREYDRLENKEVKGYRFEGFENDQDFMYANTFNVKTGEFHASINYRNADSKVAEDEKLPPALSNSEIIWFQQEHAKRVYQEKNPDSGELKSITSISRNQIGNTRTLDTIFMSDENRVAFGGGTVVLNEPTEEAIALLGTPNGNSSVWILIQHAASGQVDIESVEFTRNGLKINYMFL